MGYWLDQERKRSERIARAHRARAMEAEGHDVFAESRKREIADSLGMYCREVSLDERQRDRRAAELEAVPTPANRISRAEALRISREIIEKAESERVQQAFTPQAATTSGGTIGAAPCAPGAIVGGSQWKCTGCDIGSVTTNMLALDQHGLPTAVAATT